MKYGIKHNAGAVSSINRFPDNIVPGTHTEITEAQYNSFLSTMRTAGIHVTFDAEKTTLSVDQVAIDAENAEKELISMRGRLRELSIEIDLAVRMGEDTTNLQAEFDALKLEYEGV